MSESNTPGPTPPTIPGPIKGTAGAPNAALWLILSILTTLFCCPPGGIVGIIFSARAMGSISSGDIAEAHNQVELASTWFFISLVLGIVLVCYILTSGR
jgi:hypothetical protein